MTLRTECEQRSGEMGGSSRVPLQREELKWIARTGTRAICWHPHSAISGSNDKNLVPSVVVVGVPVGTRIVYCDPP